MSVSWFRKPGRSTCIAVPSLRASSSAYTYPISSHTYICSCYTMPDEVESNGGEVSDAMSENDLEYDENDVSLKDDDKMTDNALKQESGPDGEVKKKYDPKDPLRPRRKKARRACFACQRAHLTCGMSPKRTTGARTCS